MEEMQEGIMQEKQQCKRFCALRYGDRRCIKILKHIVGHAMHAKERADRREGMSCL